MTRRRNKKYSKELKEQAMQEYLSGAGSYVTVSKSFGTRSKTQLGSWVLWYNDYKEFKESRGAGRGLYMTKGQKTTIEERIEIVSFCLEHGRDNHLAISTHGVSYQQIYA